MRRLYLRIYLAVLASLAVFALVAGLLWRSFGQPWWSDDTLTIVARNVLPPAAAPASEQQATLERLARDLRIDLALFAPDGAKLAGVGRPIGPPKRVGRQSGMRGPPVWAVMLEDAMYPATFLDPDEPVANAFRLFRKTHRPMSVVRDPNGVVQGVITLEDVLEEIVGDIEDEHDVPVPKLKLARRRVPAPNSRPGGASGPHRILDPKDRPK